MAEAKPASRPRILIAKESFLANWGGVEQQFLQNETRVSEDDPRLEGIRHLFEPIDASFGYEQATADPVDINKMIIAE